MNAEEGLPDCSALEQTVELELMPRYRGHSDEQRAPGLLEKHAQWGVDASEGGWLEFPFAEDPSYIIYI